MEFFNFLIKHKCHNILNKEIGECLLIHPRNLTFWKIAAYNEFENNFNSITARNLFQKSIRLNQNNIETHLEYFIFELKFAEKVAERRKILLGDKETKIKFIEDEDFLSKQSLVKEVDMSHDAEEKKSEQDNTTELLKLEIPEIIWKQAHILFKHKDNSKELDIQFLGALMKYGSKLDYKGLKEKIICSLRENDSSIDTEIQIQRCLLEKYDKKDYIKKLVEKFDKLLKSNPQEYCNKFISSAFNFLESKFINERDINEIEKSNIFSYVWEKLKNQIDIEEISKNFTEDYNLRIIKFLSDHKVFKSNVLNDLINKIIDNLFTIKDSTILTEFFNVWKNHIMNFNLDMDTIFDTLALKMKNVKSGNNTFYANLLFQVCELIEDEVHFSPEKTMSYLTRIEDMIFHIKDLSSKREVYKKLVKIIYVSIKF